MTCDCERLLLQYSLDKSQWRELEEALFYADRVPQLENLIKKHRTLKNGDPYKIADYREMARRMFGMSKSLNDGFWKVYDALDSVCSMTKYDLDKVNEMSSSPVRFRIAMRISRVMNVSYIYKIWQDTQEERVVNNLDKVFSALTPHNIKTVSF